jgi:putative exporter of polyketide antibiotics
VRSDAGAQLPTATQCPGPGKEQAMILIGLIIIAVIMLLTVRRIHRKP